MGLVDLAVIGQHRHHLRIIHTDRDAREFNTRCQLIRNFHRHTADAGRNSERHLPAQSVGLVVAGGVLLSLELFRDPQRGFRHDRTGIPVHFLAIHVQDDLVDHLINPVRFVTVGHILQGDGGCVLRGRNAVGNIDGKALVFPIYRHTAWHDRAALAKLIHKGHFGDIIGGQVMIAGQHILNRSSHRLALRSGDFNFPGDFVPVAVLFRFQGLFGDRFYHFIVCSRNRLAFYPDRICDTLVKLDNRRIVRNLITIVAFIYEIIVDVFQHCVKVLKILIHC